MDDFLERDKLVFNVCSNKANAFTRPTLDCYYAISRAAYHALPCPEVRCADMARCREIRGDVPHALPRPALPRGAHPTPTPNPNPNPPPIPIPTRTRTRTPTPNQLCDRTARGRRLLRATATLLAPWSAATYRGRAAPYRTPVRGRVASQPMDSRLLGELT